MHQSELSPPAGLPEPPLRLTDSPWFWALMFAVMALVGIVAIAPKFDRRQRQVEGRFLGRQEAAVERQRRADGLPATDLAESARPPDARPPERIVPLWTRASLAAAAAAGSAAMLAREAARRHPMIERRRET
ncbi:MAG: hypothetical protein ACKOOF_11925 [Planctomycetaceae bacterium]